MRLDERQTAFVGHLLNLAHEGKEDRGALADLRSGLGKEPGQMARVHKYVVPYLPEKDYNDRWYYVTATLLGLFPEQREKCSLGRAFRPLAFPPEGQKKDSMEARFVALLNAHPDDLDDHLRHAVRLLESAKPPQPLDWFQLFADLLQWDHPEGHVQLRWARDFYRAKGSKTGPATGTDANHISTQEVEDHE
jgi:CRISPR system Cascade subunit CasB